MTGPACAPSTPAQPVWRYSALDLYPLPDAVPSARLHARHVATEWGHVTIVRTAELIVSELVTNAVRAAREVATEAGAPPVRLRLTDLSPGVQIEVWDGCRRMPERSPAGTPDAEGGRGLVLVDALADRWGAYRTAEGKVVWAVLTT